MTTSETIKSGMIALREAQQTALSAIAEAGDDDMLRAIAFADGIQQVRMALTPDTVAGVAALAGTPLGFRTDRDNKEGGGTAYSGHTLRDCVLTALLRGLSLVGNQFNIISGQMYITKEGWAAMLKQLPGLTDLDYHVGMPERSPFNQSVLLISASATCKIDGNPVSVRAEKSGEADYRLAVSAHKDNVDQARGKATARILRMLYERLTGSDLSQHDESAVEVATASEPAKLEDEWQQYLTPFAEAPDDIRQAAEGVRRMSSTEDIRAAYASAQELHKKAGLSKRYVDAMRHLCQFAEGRLQA